LRHRDYTTISNGLVDDALASLALKHLDKILESYLEIIRANHLILKRWVKSEQLIDWVPPNAGSIAFLKHRLM